ncbi:MAG: acetyl-CoA carboxylase biotin carboxylase subunit, partial [Rhodospirillaceae bacterium]|nr:acetyl-CoA carboxylase biotin carboxylase subunit [Rhodospirillaceae bacterium]
MPISRVFIANRGEIAVRIIRACRAAGLECVIGVSAADRAGLGAELADRAVVLGPAPARDSYLNLPLIVHAAKATGCDALHPGYGFLSERAELAELSEENGIAFVGPRPETIEMLGDKLRAREMAEQAGLARVPGSAALADAGEARQAAEEIGYPVVLKASAGGGGRGMFVARDAESIERSFQRASAEALAAFGDGTLYMESYVENARHVEVQVMGDGEGRVVHFGARDCSVQRRYQKVIEEAPATALTAKSHDKVLELAVTLAAHLDYRNAGTVEFLYDMARDALYFIEVNARIQVEHPVSEEISGADLVREQLRIAAGDGLSVAQSDIKLAGHAIECRINAEDPAKGFAPSPGHITHWHAPEGADVRLDSHCREGDTVAPFYDSLIGKLIVRGPDRASAIERMRAALQDFEVGGIASNIALQREIMAHPDFAA